MKPSNPIGAIVYTAVAIACLPILIGCSTGRKRAAEEPTLPRVRWYAHCETCRWCKGSYKTSEEAQAIVSSHNKRLHDWIKVAYYDQTKCP